MSVAKTYRRKAKTESHWEFLYMPEIVFGWDSLNIDACGAKIPINTFPDMGDYWMPVFNSEEECKLHYPNCRVKIIKKGF